MNLLAFEFKKYLFKPYIIFLVLFCTLINLMGAYLSCAYYKQIYDHENFQKIYNRFLRGALTEEKINFVISETKRLQKLTADQTASRDYDPKTYTGNLYGDRFLFSLDIYPEVKYAVSYAYDNQRVVEKASDNIEFFAAKNNLYERRKNEQIVSIYRNRVIRDFYDLKGMKYFVFYDFSSLMILLLCVLIIAPVFIGEKETKMDQLTPSFKKGDVRLVWTKIIFTFTVVLFISLWFSVCDLIGFSVIAPLDGFNAPVFAMKVFQFTPLNIRLYQYILLGFALKTLGIGTLISLVLLASRVFDRITYVFGSSAGVILITYLAQFVAKASFPFYELINPALLIKNRYLFMNYTAQNIFDYPVQSVIVAVAANLTIIASVVALIILASRNVCLPKRQIYMEAKA